MYENTLLACSAFTSYLLYISINTLQNAYSVLARSFDVWRKYQHTKFE